jgi:competence protein ComEA
MKLLSCLLLALLPALAWAEPVNINTADADTLARELKGVGEARARAIVEHRTQHGPFRSADELSLVKGIGQKVVDQNRGNIRVERSPRPAASAPAVVRPQASPRPAPAR